MSEPRDPVERMVETAVLGSIGPMPEYSVIEHVLYYFPAAKTAARVHEAITACLARGSIVRTDVDSIGPNYQTGAIPGFADPLCVSAHCMWKTGPDTYCHGDSTLVVERARWKACKVIARCPTCGRMLLQERGRAGTAQFLDMSPALSSERRRLAHKATLTDAELARLSELNDLIHGIPEIDRRPPLTPEQRAAQRALAERLVAKIVAEERAEEAAAAPAR